MKNSASEIYVMDHAMAYQHAFGYIRQLAVHLRNSMRVKSKVRSSIFSFDMKLILIAEFVGGVQTSVQLAIRSLR